MIVYHIIDDVFGLWARALGSTLLISAAPYFLLYFINLDNTDAMKPRLKVLLAFASGGLLGKYTYTIWNYVDSFVCCLLLKLYLEFQLISSFHISFLR